MDHPYHSSSPLRAIPVLAVIALLTSLAIVPVFFSSNAQKQKGKGLIERTESHADGIPNYDIRLDKNSIVKRGELRLRDNIGADSAADYRDAFAAAENKLRTRMPQLKVEYSPETGVPEVIGLDAISGKSSIESAKGGDRVALLRGFLRSNKDLVGVPDTQVDELTAVADYTNPAGNMSWVILDQSIDGIPVFRGEVVAGFTKNGSLARVVNSLAAGVDPSNLSREFNDPRTAIASAAVFVGHELRPFETELNEKASDANRSVFGEGDFGTVAEKMYFPLEPGTVIPTWRVLIRQDVASYYVIVDARSGELLWRKNLTEDQTQSASYRVYTNPNAMANIADSPFPITPGPTSPNFATQGSAISRTLVTRIGNESPYEFNSLGWLTDGANTLDGNNVQAGLDRENPNTGSPANPADIDPTGVPTASSGRTFDFQLNPATPDPTGTQTGDSPLPAGQTPTGCLAANTNVPTDFQKAVTTQLFYITNVYHDEMYRLGFTEQHRNFQNNNFGRGGVGSDRVSAQAQDCSGTNNANFTTPSDGNRPTMQMYLWPNPAIDMDGSLDADVIIHELTHGLSNRLHSNAGGLGSLDFSRGMGEGWSDFYSHSLLSEPTDPINGVYTTGAYDTYQFRGALNTFGNSYYGIRRFPKAVMAFTGGPSDRPHNPLTFADIDATKINITDGAYNPAFNGTADQVHNIGEVWSSALWEVRARMVQRLGWANGNRRVLQIVTDGMKLSPANPNFITGRDAIIAAATAGGSADDVEDVWRGFAIRGVGVGASVQSNGGVSTGGLGTIRVTEAFDLPNVRQDPEMTWSDNATGDGDGVAEPGETLRLSVPIINPRGETATNVSVQVVGAQTVDYGTLIFNQTATHTFDLTLPANLACGSVVDVTINVTSSLGATAFTRKIYTGVPVVTATENFDAVTAPAFPSGWEVTNEVNGTANPFRTTTTTPNSAPNAAFAPNPPGQTSGQNGATSLTSPSYAIQTASGTVSFRHRYDTEATWDGGVLEISIDGGAYQDILDAGGAFKQNGYNGFLNDNDNPIDLRNAWTGNSGGYITTIAQLPASAAGKNIRLRWRFGMDNNTGAEGWFVDDVAVSGQSQCSFASTSRKRSDFDGDGRSDYSVFRQEGSGTWYVLPANGSSFFGYSWGSTTDIPVPADYDDDGKTDAAVYRRGTGGNPGTFYVLKSTDFTFTAMEWGGGSDIPVIRDYDGDNRADFAVYRPSDGTWYVYEGDGGFNFFQFGAPGDVPVPGDFDGDGKGDFTVFRDGIWYSRKSSNGEITGMGWGNSSDRLVPADYDNDGRDDIAIFRPSDGMWWIFRSSDSAISGVQWGGQINDIPVPGDYDGDGKYDPAVYRAGYWYVLNSSTGFGSAAFGSPTDTPVAKAYLP